MGKLLTVTVLLMLLSAGYMYAQEAESLPRDKAGNIEEPVKAISIQDRIRAYEKSREMATLNEGFELGVIPINWTIYNNDGDSYEWQAYNSATYAHTGTYSARIHWNSGQNDDWLITPPLIIQSGVGDTLKFWARRYSTTYPEDFRILVSTTDNQIASFTDVLLDTTLQALGIGTTYQQIAIPLDAYDGQTIYVAYHYDATNDFYTHLDDFTGPEIYVPPYGIFTTPTSFIDLNIPYGGVVQVGDQSSEYVYITNSGGADLTITSINTSSTDITPGVNSLSIAPGVTDSVLVTWAPTIAGRDTGWVEFVSNDPAGPDTVEFSLHSVDANAYVINFELDPDSWINPIGYGLSVSGTYGYTTINQHWGVQGNWWGSPWYETSLLYSPRLDLTSGPTEMSFYHKGASSTADDTIDVNISTDGGTTWVLLGSVTNTGTDWKYQVFDLSAYSGNDDVYVQWDYRFPTGSSSGSSWYMDDLTLPARYIPPIGVIYAIPSNIDFGFVPLGSSDTVSVNLANAGSSTVNITSIISDNAAFTLSDIPTSVGSLQSEIFQVIYIPTAFGGTDSGNISITHDGINGTEEVLVIPVRGKDPTIINFPYSEAFENGGDIPARWENDPNDSGKDWDFGTSTTYGATQDHTTGDGYLAYVDDSTPNPTDPTNLLSPPMDLTNLVNPFMDFYFWSFNEQSTPQDTAYLHIDVWDGATWNLDVMDSIGQVAEEWRHARVSLAAFKSTGTKIRFRVIETPSFYHDIGIDDVKIYDAINWANLQWPPSTSTLVGYPTENIYGQVWIDGVTNQPGVTPGLVAEVGYGPDGSMPYDQLTGTANSEWIWTATTFNLDAGNNDEFMGNITPADTGSFDYAYRYSWNGSPWIYADQDGINNGYDPAQAGTLTVLPLEGTQKLLLTEIVVTPTAGEYIEFYNPTPDPVELRNYYITDATFAGGETYYYNIVTGTNAGGGSFADFNARFPDGATIQPGEYQTIALAGDSLFFEEYGVVPTYELYEDSTSFANDVPNMREALPGSINNQGGLTNGDEVVILYYWDGLSDLVQDVDYLLYNQNSPTPNDEAVDKTGVRRDGPDADTDSSQYLPDTPVASQVSAPSHSSGSSVHRIDFSEGTQVQTGGNGITGSNETSENLNETFTNNSVPSPNGAWEPAQSARVQIVHNAADPAADTVDVYLNGALLVDDFTFRTAIPFINAPPGIMVNIGVAPGNSASVSDTIKNFITEFEANKTYLGFVTGVLDTANFAANPDGKDISFTIFGTDSAQESASTTGNVEFLVAHGATDAPTVNVLARGVGVLASDLSYGDVSVPYRSVSPTFYLLDIETGGTVVASFAADLSGLADSALAVFASGFLDPVANQDGPAFGLFAALPGGSVIELPAISLTPPSNLVAHQDESFALKVNLMWTAPGALESMIFKRGSKIPANLQQLQPVEGFAYYNIYRASSADTIFSQIATNIMETSYVDSMGISYDSLYFYYVTAYYDPEGESSPSNISRVIPIQTPPMILVVDDDGSNVGYDDVGAFYTNALDQLGSAYYYYEVIYPFSGPPANFLKNFSVVLWTTGETWTGSSTLLPEDEEALAEFLDAGGNLYLNGQDYLYDRYPNAGAFTAGEFPLDYLKVTSVAQDAWTNPASTSGGSGSFADGLSFSLSTPFGTTDLYVDNLSSTDGTPVFMMTSPAGFSALQYSGTYRLIFSTLDFGGFQNGTAPNTRQELMKRALMFLDPAVVGITSQENLPITFALAQNYPNPFNPTTTIKYQIPKAVEVQIDIFNIVGQKVRTLVNDQHEAGYYQIVWDGKNDLGNRVASGLYIYRIKAGEFVKARKMILMK